MILYELDEDGFQRQGIVWKHMKNFVESHHVKLPYISIEKTLGIFKEKRHYWYTREQYWDYYTDPKDRQVSTLGSKQK